MKKKDEIPADSLAFVDYIVTIKQKPPKYIRMDNSEENKKFSRMCKKKYPSIIYEFTAKDTAHQNGKVEAAIAATWGQVRAMIDAVELPDHKRKRL